jgi:hypothetical protein
MVEEERRVNDEWRLRRGEGTWVSSSQWWLDAQGALDSFLWPPKVRSVPVAEQSQSQGQKPSPESRKGKMWISLGRQKRKVGSQLERHHRRQVCAVSWDGSLEADWSSQRARRPLSCVHSLERWARETLSLLLLPLLLLQDREQQEEERGEEGRYRERMKRAMTKTCTRRPEEASEQRRKAETWKTGAKVCHELTWW